MADLRGGARPSRPPLAQNFFIFVQFSGKIGQIIGWRPPLLGLAPPPLGNPGSATANVKKSTAGLWKRFVKKNLTQWGSRNDISFFMPHSHQKPLKCPQKIFSSNYNSRLTFDIFQTFGHIFSLHQKTICDALTQNVLQNFVSKSGSSPKMHTRWQHQIPCIPWAPPPQKWKFQFRTGLRKFEVDF